ncbi:hypothetical protein BOTBODRAFT_65905 [Botryobasidium botryosum FD-172 SS1]|uniref:Uncharacterized protein n=1 Tax=Botryobasidium botryosum (strain FD-172 SS1) TaxID=930990 RepID=A0A067MHG3_BOTB1|nr:hypothetical protein BOTBODRAFT_65905 [Botryobasidium botryosum FD-172 SS1]
MKYCSVACSGQTLSMTSTAAVLARYWDTRLDPISSNNFQITLEFRFLQTKIDFDKFKGCVESVRDRRNVQLKFGIKCFAMHSGNRRFNDGTLKQFSRHPARLYETWISDNDLKKLNALGLSQKPRSRALSAKARGFPAKARVDDAHKYLYESIGQKDWPQAATTETDITKAKVKEARRYTGTRNQNAVMNDRPAAEIAKILWNKPVEKLAVEWLHRSAFSFGGLGDSSRPLAAQVPKNLVFGTYETNTQMIRWEDFVKRVATHGTGVHVRTSLDYTGVSVKETRQWIEEKKPSWIASGLSYNISSAARVSNSTKPSIESKRGAKGSPKEPKRPEQPGPEKGRQEDVFDKHIFHLFERINPLKLEFYLDQEVEKVVYGWGVKKTTATT